jgi:glycosyltransferase involved in cell wall biosynthesis
MSAAQRVPGLSVVLPAYNEELNVVPVVEQALDCLPRVADDYEVIVVDDGSTDGTAAALAQLLADHHPRLRLLRHERNQGYGAALRTGFSRARYDHVFYTDADRQFDIGEIEYLLPLLREYDAVVGFRVYRYDSPTRLVASTVYNWIVRILFRVRVRDVDCSFKLFRREVLDKVTIECTDFFVDTELVAKARKWNFRIIEKGVRHYARVAGETSVRASDVPRTLRTIAHMWLRIHRPTAAQVEAAERMREAALAAPVEVTPVRAETAPASD